MAGFYRESHRQLQDRFDTRRLADRLDERIVHDRLTDNERAFIERMDMFFLATADAEGRPDCSFKGGVPGFVRVLAPRELAWPDYDGNGQFRSLGNLRVNPQAGLLFIDWERPSRLRVNGVVTISADDVLRASWERAQLVIRLAVQQVFPNCPRYIHRYALVERSRFVPKEDCRTPAPQWKRSDWAQDVLPAGDPALGPDAEVIPRG
jgi:predicted pyridoxine 5'-phosphate oxidase superfamily flavin-nucleotide-binding protein